MWNEEKRFTYHEYIHKKDMGTKCHLA